MKKISIWIYVSILLLLGVFYALYLTLWSQNKPAALRQNNNEKLFATVLYMCNGGKKLTAQYFENASKPIAIPGQPPIPSGRVMVALDDGRSLNLPRTISADGLRYANNDESFVFWSKNNGVLILENGQEKNYTGCIEIAPNDTKNDLDQIYESGAKGFSIRYPQGYTLNESFQNQLSPNKKISGVQFKIPASLAEGTNLAPDSYVSVEQIPNAQNCAANIFLYASKIKTINITEGGNDYSVASTTDAAAGNRYQETIYA
ncbi:MAG: MliC family protein, partial [Patescibacteria group bacterium]|nr:MliC family protein [Patescibacteria group bacterium]